MQDLRPLETTAPSEPIADVELDREGEPSPDGEDARVDVFSACPASAGVAGADYGDRVRTVSRWSEAHGCRGMLIYSDNRQLDPWMVSQIAVRSTRRLAPLVAVQPAYAHPYVVAKAIATLASLYGRRLFINWVAGGFKNDLRALADDTPHDARYDRLVEYATVVRKLTDGERVTFEGDYHRVRGLELRPPVSSALRPGFMVSGSSPAGRSASRILGARAVTCALPPEEGQRPPSASPLRSGLRVGIIARARREDAWRTAYRRFPVDRQGELTRDLARSVSDSHWHSSLCRVADDRAGEGTPFWTRPFESYKAMCPYLVGSHDEVAEVLATWVSRGFRTFILDEPKTETDLAEAVPLVEAAASRAVEATGRVGP